MKLIKLLLTLLASSNNYPTELVEKVNGMCRPHWYGTFTLGHPCRVCGARLNNLFDPASSF